MPRPAARSASTRLARPGREEVAEAYLAVPAAGDLPLEARDDPGDLLAAAAGGGARPGRRRRGDGGGGLPVARARSCAQRASAAARSAEPGSSSCASA